MADKLIYRKNILMLLMLTSMVGIKCKKEKTNSFCEVKRSTYKTISNKEGTIGYYENYKRWAVYEKESIANNIDSKIVGLLCDIPEELKITGVAVTVSGIYKSFDTRENIKPQLGGEEVYYLEVIKIQKQ